MTILQANLMKDDFSQKIYEKSMKDLSVFFGAKPNHLPLVIIINDRKTIDKIFGRKTEPWIVGWQRNGNIYLLNRKNYKTESNHTYEKGQYAALVKHEICHLFFSVLSKGKSRPCWFNEGVAIFLSGQNKFKKIPCKFNQFLRFHTKTGAGVYYESGFAVQLLVNKFGKKKLLDLIKSLKNIKTTAQFRKRFNSIYGFKPSYSDFNKLLKSKKSQPQQAAGHFGIFTPKNGNQISAASSGV